MNIYLVLLSFAVTFVLFFPFIGVMYKLKMRDPGGKKIDFQGNDTPIHNMLKKSKGGVPIGGGLLVVVTTVLIYQLALNRDVQLYSIEGILLFAFISFGFVGLIDDYTKTFSVRNIFLPLGMKLKLLIQLMLSAFIAYVLVVKLEVSIYEFSTFISLGIVTFSIAFLANAFNITDGVDGLAAGLLLIAILPILIISYMVGIDAIYLFLIILFGSTLAYLYFNISPARIFMGDAGSMAFGSVLAVVGLLTMPIHIVSIICLVFILEAITSALQITWKILFKKKLFPIAPFHHLLEFKGWDSSKISLRFYIVGIILSLVSLQVYFG